MKQGQNYRLTLIEGDYFYGDPKSYFISLFRHFNFLSWFSSSSDVQILEKQTIEKNGKEFKIYTYSIGKSKACFLLQFDKNEDKSEISYCSFDDRSAIDNAVASKKLQAKIKVVFSMHNETSKLQKDKTRTVIFIDIIDSQSFVKSKNLTNLDQKLSKKKNRNQLNQIHYPYKEPTSRRFKENNQCHFNLAFQGGGAKGVSYVGVYKALKQLHSGVPISSVIGSSAGGILALAISSEMSPSDISDLCLEMDEIPQDKYFKNESEITPERQKQFDNIIFKLKCLLHNYGIIQCTIFDQFLQCVGDVQTDNKILNVLEAINPSIAQLFSLKLKQPIRQSKGVFSTEKITYQNRFNYYGLLMAGMMKGNAVQNIAASCLISFIQKHFDKKYMDKHPQYKDRIPTITKIITKWGFKQINNGLFQSDQFREKVKSLTLKQYYSINQIEFTCTSVDLQDQILRFFNHKTTPDLPVCKTVQMTGSFPVAFQAQKWKPQWGKYFVHYRNSRKEIDLTGHEFTDGGLLANFPIKYLDNQHMRPMYFSHKQHPQRTILYGFGLDPVADPQTNSEILKQKYDLAVADLKSHLSSKFSKGRLLLNLIRSDSQKQLPQVHIEQIPVFNYVLKLIKTFKVADYNLNRECFEKSIIQMPVEGRFISQNKILSKQIEKYVSLLQSLDNLEKISISKQGLQPQQLLANTCEKFRIQLTEYETSQNRVVEQTRLHALQSFYNFEGARIRNKFKPNKEINEFVNSLEDLYPIEYFKMQSSQQIKLKLIEIICSIKQHFKNLSQELKSELQVIFKGMIQAQLEIIFRIKERIKIIIKQLQSIQGEYISGQQYSEITFIDFQLVFDLITMERKFFIADQQYIRQIIQEIKRLDIPVISIDKEIMDNSGTIQTYIENIVKSSKSNKIHLVFESVQNSHLYYCGLYSILQEVLNKSSNQDKHIEMITCADFHSVFAFLLAGGKKINNIRKEMWRVKDLISLQKDIEKRYQSFKWAQTYSQEMNQLLQLTWTDQYKLFDEMQRYLDGTNHAQFKKQIRAMKIQFVYSKESITNAMQSLLHYVLESAKEVEKIKDETLRKKKLAQLLSLRNGKVKDYEKKNKMISQNTQRLINKLMYHFQQLIAYVVLNNYFMPSSLQQFTTGQSQLVWKGVLVKKLLSSKRLELYLKEKLQEMKLNSNTTLSQFYQFSPRKITLNFTLVNKGEQRLQIVNRFTKPNMPLWAAIVASTSMPYMLPAFASDQEWEFSPYTDSRMRKMVNYFFDTEEKSLQTYYIAGNYLSTLPLELLTNQKIARENYCCIKNYQETMIKANQYSQSTTSTFNHDFSAIKQQTNFTYITFSFARRHQKQNTYKYQATNKHFLTFSNLLNIGLDFLGGRFKNIEVGFKDILRRVELLKLVQTRIESHDNTIMYYYKDQTIKLPIRLQTLDFYKIQRGKQATLNSCIYQAEFVVRGIFENLQIDSQKNTFKYLAKKHTYLQYKTVDDKIIIKFPSKSKWDKKLSTIYRIFYRLNKNEDYNEYQEDGIHLSKQVNLIYLKIVFANMKIMRLQQQQLEVDFSGLKQDEQYQQNLIFKFNYDIVCNKRLKGITVDVSRLKTKMLCTMKSMKSEHNPTLEMSEARFDKIQELGPLRKVASSAQGQKVLTIRTLVSFKHNGLYCHDCTHPLKRPDRFKQKQNSFEVGKCGRCKNSFNIIGVECVNKECLLPEVNKFCFPCILVYLISRRDGNYICTSQNHVFKYYTSEGNSDIQLCHFCSSAANNYYRDEKCNINVCFKCSLILDSKTTISL